MACYHPLDAWRTSEGEVVFVERGDVVSTLSLPCGRCIGCRIERSRQWSVRVMHEAALYEENCFLTLTYDDDHVPYRGSLDYSDFQRFLKRLRRLRAGKTLRFFACGEYGERLGRPHFHCALFNEAFLSDRKVWRRTKSYVVFRSPTLEKLWPYGLSEIGELTVKSAAYIARYSLKKVVGDLAPDHYRRVDDATGEVYYLEPEMLHMSLRPGIGAAWFDRFSGDVYPHDRLVVGGVVQRPPRFYDKLLERVEPGLLEELKGGRTERAKERYLDNTYERLKVKEAVTAARMRFYKRELK